MKKKPEKLSEFIGRLVPPAKKLAEQQKLATAYAEAKEHAKRK